MKYALNCRLRSITETARHPERAAEKQRAGPRTETDPRSLEHMISQRDQGGVPAALAISASDRAFMYTRIEDGTAERARIVGGSADQKDPGMALKVVTRRGVLMMQPE
jgi:hypothetical protein